MKNNKLLLATLAGSTTFFLLGWPFYGFLFADFFDSHSGLTENLMLKFNKSPGQINWAAAILSNLAQGLLITIIFVWCHIKTFIRGAKTGSIIGLFNVYKF